MDVLINSTPEWRISTTTMAYNSLPVRGRRARTPDISVLTLEDNRNFKSSPYRMILSSSLPRTIDCRGDKIRPRAMSDAPLDPIKNASTHNVSPISAFDANLSEPSQKPEDVRMKEVYDGIYKTVHTTTHTTPPKAKQYDDTVNLARANAILTPPSLFNNRSVAAINKTYSTNGAIKSSQVPPGATEALAQWISTLPSPRSQTVPALWSPPQPAHNDATEGVNTVTHAMSATGHNEQGNIVTINDMNIGNNTIRVTEQEVETSCARTEGTLAARRRVETTRGKKCRLRAMLKRIWRRMRRRTPRA